MSGLRSRRKGLRGEQEFVNLYGGERVPLSGAQGVAQKLVKNILEAAGFFDLLEAAEEIYNEFGYVLPLPQEHRLRDAIRKANGGTP